MGACSTPSQRFSGKNHDGDAPAALNELSGVNKSESAQQGADQVLRGYSVRLSSTDDRKLNGLYRVRFDGRLDLPYDVNFSDASKLSLTELRNQVREKYKPFFTGPVNVDVQIADRRVYVEVRGLVSKTGQQLVAREAGLDEVLALAGGVQANSQVDEALVRRVDGSSVTMGLGSLFESGGELGPWQGGETVFFRPAEGRSQFRDSARESVSVQILGEVRKPGFVLFREGADFMYYFTRAEGPTAMSDLDRIEIIRGKIPGAEAIRVRIKDTNQLPQLQAGDVVIVRAVQPSFIERAAPVISAVSSIIGTILLFIVIL